MASRSFPVSLLYPKLSHYEDANRATRSSSQRMLKLPYPDGAMLSKNNFPLLLSSTLPMLLSAFVAHDLFFPALFPDTFDQAWSRDNVLRLSRKFWLE